MDSGFDNFLSTSGVSGSTKTVLIEQGIVNKSVFSSLREEHFEKLLPKLTLGQHALLMKLWDSAASGYGWRGGQREVSPPGTSPGTSASASSASSSHDQSFSVPRSFNKGKPCFTRSASPPSKLNVKELAQLYRQRSLERTKGKGKMKLPVNQSQTMLVTFGGMIYDSELNRGVRKKYLPEPNPQKVEFPRDASLTSVFEKAIHLFFQDLEVDSEALSLADSGGVLIPVQDRDSWSLSVFYSKNRLQPSRYKLYVVAGSQEDQEHESDTETPSKLVHTECMITPCTDCEQPFRTYVPDTICRLPDGGSVFYRDPQNLCPVCDLSGFGTFWNLDLFPQLQPKKPSEKEA